MNGSRSSGCECRPANRLLCYVRQSVNWSLNTVKRLEQTSNNAIICIFLERAFLQANPLPCDENIFSVSGAKPTSLFKNIYISCKYAN